MSKESTHSKVDASRMVCMSLRTPPILWADRIGIFLFLLVPLIEKGKKRNN